MLQTCPDALLTAGCGHRKNIDEKVKWEIEKS
jgi:hypothetical protein